MAKIVVVPDEVDVPGALDVTDVVRLLWNTSQWCVDEGYDVAEDYQPAFEEFRAAAGFWTQEQYVMDKFDRFRKHGEWLDEMRRTGWGMTTEGGL